MGTDWLGQVYSLLAALTWAFALVLFKRSGERVPPIALNLFKDVVGLMLFLATLTCQGEGLGTLRTFPPREVGILALSGVLGIAAADTVFFYSLNLIGVGLLSVVDCLYSPFVILFSWLLLDERLSSFHYVGGGLILLGVLISSGHKPPGSRTRGQLVAGVWLGALALALMAFSIVMVKPILGHFPLPWAASIRLVAGTGALMLLILASPNRRQYGSVFRPAAVWRYSVPAAVLGTYFALLFWIAGFKYTYASIAAILNQTSVILAMILATLILKEPFTRRKAISVTLAMVGTVVVTLNSALAIWF